MKHLIRNLILLAATLALIAVAVSSAIASPGKAKAPTAYQTMIIVGHTLGQKGADGLTHDTTYGANLTLEKGQRVVVTVYNFDEGPHTITAPGLKLNVKIPGATDEEKGVPSKTIFSFTPTKVGTFRWFCSLPCDAGQKYWAMSATRKGIGRDGFMAGYFTVTA
jgi:hypothetical protein